MFRITLNQNRQKEDSTQKTKNKVSYYLYILNLRIKKVIKSIKYKFLILTREDGKVKKTCCKFKMTFKTFLNKLKFIKNLILNKLISVLKTWCNTTKIKLSELIIPIIIKYYDLSTEKMNLITEKIKNYFKIKKDAFIQAIDPVKKAYSNGPMAAAKECVLLLKRDFKNNPKRWVAAFHIALPVAAIAILFCTVSYWNNLDYGLVLAYEGEEIATIENESVFEKANQMVNQRLVYGRVNESEPNFEITPKYKLAAITSEKYSTPSVVCDKIIQQSKGSIEEATGLYINDELLGVVKNNYELKSVLDGILEENRTKEDAEVSFVENVEKVRGLYPASIILNADNLKNLLTSPTEEEVYYKIKDGDTPSDIAESFNMSLEDLENINNTPIDELIFPDEEIKVKAKKSLLNVSVSYLENYEASIPYQEIKDEDDSHYIGYSLITQEGEEGLLNCVDKVTYVNGIETARQEISRETIKDAVNKYVTVGSMPDPSKSSQKRPSYPQGDGISTGYFEWPVPGIRTISSPFGMRWGCMHYGIDIANGNSYGRTIVAADGGTVTKAYDSGDGYGICVIINHRNGMSTLYAHCSSAYTSPGQTVSKGQSIAAIGSTGYSDGAHLHFGVIVHGSFVNPLNYL